ncbi:MAG: 5,10-methylene tetrahydromethanopterin reductase, partial [Lachnospiraceae bacterium]|nr:5,10-methylene tetrahydromethanopterin reductase [Lachnospiraceae bacterium]
MLITGLKEKETLLSLTGGRKVFIINCHGCREVHFPEKEAEELQKELQASGNVMGSITTEYVCNPENMKLNLERNMDKIEAADVVFVFSCG